MSMTVLSVGLGVSTAGNARAGGGSALSAVQLLRHAAIASALQRSAHLHGTVALSDISNVKGITFKVGGGAYFSGNVSDRGKPQLQLRGGYQFLNQAKSFKVKVVGTKTASKLGKGVWQCGSSSTAGGLSTTPIPITGLGKLRHWLLALARRVMIANLGPSTLGGIPVWEVQAKLHTRFDLTSLVAGTRQAIARTARVGSIQRDLQRLISARKSWATVTVNVWISQLRYTVLRVAARFLLREHTQTLGLSAQVNISRYGEPVKVVLPAKCA